MLVTQTVTPSEEPEGLQLKKTVFLGYCDVAAGGLRALLGLNMRKVFHTVEIVELKDRKLACKREIAVDPREQEYDLVQIWNLKYEEVRRTTIRSRMSLKLGDIQTQTAVLAAFERLKKNPHRLIMGIMFCVERLVVLSALRVEVSLNDIHDIYENPISAKPLTECPHLPNDAKICDPFLSTLIQMIQVEHQPTSLLIIPAHRACLGKAKIEDGSQQVIEKFQEVINQVTKLRFDKDISLNLIYKGDNVSDSQQVSMMYS